MLTASGPKVLEFNCRLGDPETQAIVARMDFDLADVLMATAEGGLQSQELKWKPAASICVVMASGGYPGTYASGKEIHGLDQANEIEGVTTFHAGTRRESNTYYTSSGRVLGVTALGGTLELARRAAYNAVHRFSFRDSSIAATSVWLHRASPMSETIDADGADGEYLRCEATSQETVIPTGGVR